MLSKLLEDEELRRILFAELLNRNGVETGVDTVNMLKGWIRENPNGTLEGYELERFKQNLIKEYGEDETMEDIPMNIRELEEKGKDEPMVTLAELEERELKNEPTERLAEPDYYAGNGLSPLEAFKKGLLSREETIGFCKGNVIKYTVRAGKKENASRDIVKAIDYLHHLKRLYEEEHHIKPNIEAVNLTNGTTKKAQEMVITALKGLDDNEDDSKFLQRLHSNK